MMFGCSLRQGVRVREVCCGDAKQVIDCLDTEISLFCFIYVIPTTSYSYVRVTVLTRVCLCTEIRPRKLVSDEFVKPTHCYVAVYVFGIFDTVRNIGYLPMRMKDSETNNGRTDSFLFSVHDSLTDVFVTNKQRKTFGEFVLNCFL